MSVTIDLEETALFHQGLPEQVCDWLTKHIGIVYHTAEIWRHNDQVIDRKLGRSQSLNTVLVTIQAHYEYPQECSLMTTIHACGWNFTGKRKFSTSPDTIAIKRQRSTLLRIEDDSLALHFAIKWMQ
jgi:hypothetical protein